MEFKELILELNPIIESCYELKTKYLEFNKKDGDIELQAELNEIMSDFKKNVITRISSKLLKL